MSLEFAKYPNVKPDPVGSSMSPLELALTMLGETTTAELARNTDAQRFRANEKAADTGGKIAGETRKNIEKQLGKKVVTKDNFIGMSNETQGRSMYGKRKGGQSAAFYVSLF